MSGVNFRCHEDICTIELDNETTRNSLNDKIVSDISSRLNEWSLKPALKGLILTGAGGTFSSGGDLKMIEVQKEKALEEGGREAITKQMRKNAQLVELLKQFPAPTIAVIDGTCVGAAIGWISACDIRIGSETSKFVTAFAKVGLSTDFGTSRLLAEIVGRGVASGWLLTSPIVSAQEALAKGLLNSLHSKEDLMTSALSMLNNMRAQSSVAIRKNLNDSHITLADALTLEAERFAQNL